MYHLGKGSVKNLKGVHPDLVAVVKRAIEITEQDFSVTEGKRSLEKQREYVKSGASKTMNSRHLTGHAVDLAPWDGRASNYAFDLCAKVARAMKDAAKELGVTIHWGWDLWHWDSPHFQLDWGAYPVRE
jgi:peptidoglycan LD-endopeptidase CwlK